MEKLRRVDMITTWAGKGALNSPLLVLPGLKSAGVKSDMAFKKEAAIVKIAVPKEQR